MIIIIKKIKNRNNNEKKNTPIVIDDVNMITSIDYDGYYNNTYNNNNNNSNIIMCIDGMISELDYDLASLKDIKKTINDTKLKSYIHINISKIILILSTLDFRRKKMYSQIVELVELIKPNINNINNTKRIKSNENNSDNDNKNNNDNKDDKKNDNNANNQKNNTKIMENDIKSTIKYQENVNAEKNSNATDNVNNTNTIKNILMVDNAANSINPKKRKYSDRDPPKKRYKFDINQLKKEKGTNAFVKRDVNTYNVNIKYLFCKDVSEAAIQLNISETELLDKWNAVYHLYFNDEKEWPYVKIMELQKQLINDDNTSKHVYDKIQTILSTNCWIFIESTHFEQSTFYKNNIIIIN